MTKPTSITAPHYVDLKSLAAYASCSVRWLRERLVDRTNPLPHYGVAGKILVKLEEFHAWMTAYRVASTSTSLNEIVESVVTQVTRPRVA